MWCVYVIQHNITFENYIGRTADIKERLREHNNAGKKFTTRKSGNWLLVYCEYYRSEIDAIERENKLKHHGSAKHELFKRIKNSLNTKTGAGCN